MISLTVNISLTRRQDRNSVDKCIHQAVSVLIIPPIILRILRECKHTQAVTFERLAGTVLRVLRVNCLLLTVNRRDAAHRTIACYKQ